MTYKGPRLHWAQIILAICALLLVVYARFRFDIWFIHWVMSTP